MHAIYLFGFHKLSCYETPYIVTFTHNFKSNDMDIKCLLMSLVWPLSLHVHLIFWNIVIKRLSLFYLFMLVFPWEKFSLI